MTDKPAHSRKKTALVLMCLAPIFALSPLIVSMIAVPVTPECTLVPNCAAGAFAYLIVLTVPIGFVVLIAGLIMLLNAKRTKNPEIG